MKPRYLFPHSFKKVGWMLFLPSLIFGIFVQHYGFEIPGFTLELGNGILVSGSPLKNNLTNELAGLLVLTSGFVVAFSKEKIAGSILFCT